MALEKIAEQPLPEKPAGPKPEKISRPEGKSRFEIPRWRPEKVKADESLSKKSEVSAQPLPVSAWQEERARAIDNILAEGLNEIFLQLKPDEQRAFKKKGEETVKEINSLLDKTRLRVEKIIALIRAWLKMIPGVNKFFLEQEVKIKADKIMKLRNKK